MINKATDIPYNCDSYHCLLSKTTSTILCPHIIFACKYILEYNKPIAVFIVSVSDLILCPASYFYNIISYHIKIDKLKYCLPPTFAENETSSVPKNPDSPSGGGSFILP